MRNIEIDFNKLRGKIKEYLGNEQLYAQKLGLSTSAISMKLNNKIPFSFDEIDRTVELLNIEHDKIYEYFFTKKVEKNSTQ